MTWMDTQDVGRLISWSTPPTLRRRLWGNYPAYILPPNSRLYKFCTYEAIESYKTGTDGRLSSAAFGNPEGAIAKSRKADVG
jgi:hypothetical protein